RTDTSYPATTILPHLCGPDGRTGSNALERMHMMTKRNDFSCPLFQESKRMGRSSVLADRRLTSWLLACLPLVLLLALFLVTAPVARAADEGDDAKPAEATKAAPIDQGKQPSIFMHIVKSVGWTFGLILLFTSIGLVALIVLLSMELRMTAAI